VGVIVLGAKMAKADGSVTTDEVKAFKEAFNVSAAEMKQAAHVFNLAKQDMAGYEACAEQLVTLFRGNRKLLEDVLGGLFHIAKADDEVHPQEEQFLGQVAKLFGFTDTEFSYIKARHVIAAERNPYDVLGVEPSVGDEDEVPLPHACRRQSAGQTHRAWGAEGVRHYCHREGRHPQQGL
jgi:DnaJ like chaperone protein